MKSPWAPGRPGGLGGSWSSGFGTYLSLGLQLAISVVAFFFLGYWLDGRCGTTPWLTIAGLVIGTAGGFIKFFRTAMQLSRKADREAQESRRREERES